MAFVYGPPGNMTDFGPELLTQWSTAVSGMFDDAISTESDTLQGAPCQFLNLANTSFNGEPLAQAIVWNALPGTFLQRYGREQALALADSLLPMYRRMDRDAPAGYNLTGPMSAMLYRPQDEYCEWHVTRNAAGKITRVDFTSEPPEYYQALHGDTLNFIPGGGTYTFPAGSPDQVVALYRQYVDPAVQAADLIWAEDVYDDDGDLLYHKGDYNPWNRWNTTDGLMHLSHPANSLFAEIKLGADATLLRQRDTFLITDPMDLISTAAYGGPDRSSDPCIGASVNELAALGMAVTIQNPVGLYMHHIDLAAFATPTGEPVTADYFQVLRGDASANMIERATFTVPEGAGDFVVGDLTIGGRPLRYGAQIAEHITVSLTGVAADPGRFGNPAYGAETGAEVYAPNSNYLSLRDPAEPAVPPFVDAFTAPPLPGRGPVKQPSPSLAATAKASPASTRPAPPHHVRHTRLA